jgi:PAS domain S-box-containing protein
MEWQTTPYTAPVFVIAGIAGGLSFWGWRRRPATGTTIFALMMLALTEWSLAYGFELAAADLATKLFWVRTQYLGIVTVPVTWLCFVLQYTGREKWLTRRNLMLLMISPLITLLLTWTNEAHNLIWSTIELDTSGSFSMLDLTYGPWFWIHSTFSYLLLLLGTLLLIRSFIRSPQLYRGQTVALLIGVFAPWVGNGLYLFDVNPLPNLDLTPFAFTVTGLAVGWGASRFRMLDIVPVARDVVIEHMNDGLIVLDAQSRIVDINPAARQLVGCSDQDLIGQPMDQALSNWADLVERCREAEEAHTEIVLGEAGSRRYFDLHFSTLRDQRQGGSGRVIVLRDTTALKEAEIALREFNQELTDQNLELRKLTRAVEQSGSTIVITDLEGDIEYVNPAFSRITGYSEQEAIGENPRILKSGEHPPEMYEEMWKTISGGEVWRGELINKKKDGQLYWEAATISPINDEAGNIVHYLAVKRDITARKQAEEAQRRYAAELEAQNAELDAFSHTVAHDLKNPLTALIGSSNLLRMRYADMSQEQREDLLQKIEQSGFKIRNIVDELLLLASVREVSEVGTSPLDMEAIVAEAQERLEHLIEDHRAEIILPERWPVAVGYGPWVEEIWVNYLSNAIKYGGRPPQVEIGATIEKEGWVRYWVRDNGEGLSSAEQARLFTPFERLHQASVEGHGLGLSVVRRIMEKLGGRVGVESEEGEGSTFYFTLPGAE